jgi:hypothetical protein
MKLAECRMWLNMRRKQRVPWDSASGCKRSSSVVRTKQFHTNDSKQSNLAPKYENRASHHIFFHVMRQKNTNLQTAPLLTEFNDTVGPVEVNSLLVERVCAACQYYSGLTAYVKYDFIRYSPHSPATRCFHASSTFKHSHLGQDTGSVKTIENFCRYRFSRLGHASAW